MRHIPIFTFINKMDRDSMDIFELLDDIERKCLRKVSTPKLVRADPKNTGDNSPRLTSSWSNSALAPSSSHVQSGRKQRLSQPQQIMAQDRKIVEEAYAGDIIGVFDPGIFSIGDILA